jgi:lipoprotein-releasing system ATP-binding protein
MLLDLKNIEKSYETPAGSATASVLRNVSLEVGQGDTLAVVGPSGSGKSTLLNIIGALDKPTSGEVILNGRNLATLSEDELARIRNTEIGFIFQLHHLLPQCTVLENVLVPTIPSGRAANSSAMSERARALLHKVGLEERIDYFPARLSVGEQQRVAVVRALMNQPKIILADEPTGSLDPESADMLGHLLLDLNHAENVALIVVTHSLKLAERMETVYQIQNGTLAIHQKS